MTEIIDVEPFAWVHWLTMAVLVRSWSWYPLPGARRPRGAHRRGDSVAAEGGQRERSIKRMPWGVILMVCGVTVLIGVLAAQGGMTSSPNCWRASRRRARSR